MIVPPRLTADRAQARAAAPPGKSELNLRFYYSILTYVLVRSYEYALLPS